ncbi:MAG TPA: hypothetical protein VFD65_00730 [Chitinophagales bacterium]|nr:hypothetical protein [Chitinophagales bacterium]
MKALFSIGQILFIIILTFLLSNILPWWTFALICFISGIGAYQLGFLSFINGFLGVGLYYFTYCFVLASKDNFAFADKIGSILGSSLNQNIDGFSLLWIGTLLFGILGGVFAWSGTLITSGFSRRNERFKKIKSLKLDLK